MSQPRIVSAVIAFPDRSQGLPALVFKDPGDESSFKAVVTATFDDGSRERVLSYYSDELSFRPEEFVGLTRDEVGELFTRKDVAYLQS